MEKFLEELELVVKSLAEPGQVEKSLVSIFVQT